MASDGSGEITRLLAAVQQGSTEANSALAGLVYEELRRIARKRMRGERPDHTFQPTALVHEAYMQLLAQEDKTWQNRAHFYAVAAQLMRRILIDHARSLKAEKRGGQQIRHVPLEVDLPSGTPNVDELLSLDSALLSLERIDPRQSRVVELRYFAGMTEDEVADVLNVSVRTIKRDWNMARVFLRDEMSRKAST